MIEVVKDIEIEVKFDAGPFVQITSKAKKDTEYNVEFWDSDSDYLVFDSMIKINKWTAFSRKWYTNWRIVVYEDSKLIYQYQLDLKGKDVFIRLASNMLGDNFAWISYVEEFRKKHNCNIFCGTLFPEIFEETYDFTFWKEGSEWPSKEFYATYEVGVFGYKNEEPFYEFDNSCNKQSLSDISMQQAATDILGLPYKEIKPKLNLEKFESKNKIEGKYVCIGIHASAQLKYWNYENGWQKIVDYFLNIGYKVIYLSREKSGFMGNKIPTGVIDKSGDLPLEDRIGDLKNAELFIGTSSGLSWLAWAVDIPVVLIHGHNHSWYNFADKTKHINLENDDSVCTGCWHTDGFAPGDWYFCPKHKDTDRQFECTKKITPEMVIEGIEVMLNDKQKSIKTLQSAINLTMDVTSEVGKMWFYNTTKSEFYVRVVDPYSDLTLYTSKITFEDNTAFWLPFKYVTPWENYYLDKLNVEVYTTDQTKIKTFDVKLNDNVVNNKDEFKYVTNKFDVSWANHKEIFYADEYKGLFDLNEDSVVLDLGAHIGVFTRWVSKQNVKVCYSLEPNPTLWNGLNKTFENSDNVKLLNNALGELTEDRWLKYPQYSTSNGSFYINDWPEIEDWVNPTNYNNPFTYERDIVVSNIKCLSFDDFIEQNKIEKIDVIKCDVEGAEYEIFRNASEDYLKENVSTILLEFHHNKDRLKPILDKLIKCGFLVKYLKGDADAYDGTILFTKKKSKPVKVGEDRWVMGANIGHDSGATLVKNGKIFVSVNSERITRIKHDEANDDFPWKAMDYCLDYAGIKKDDLERIVWNGIGLPPELAIDPNGLWASRLKENGYNFSEDRLNYCTHHLAHAYSAHYSSGFEESVSIVVDAGGETNYREVIDKFFTNKIAHMKKYPIEKCVEASSIYEIKKGVFTKIYSAFKPFPEADLWPTLGQSIGEFYALGCNYIGMDGLYDAGKLMGLASYGRPEESKKRFDEPVVYLDPDPKSGDYFIRVHHAVPREEQTSETLMYIDTPRPIYWNSNISGEDFQSKADWAWMVQHQFEKMILFLAKKASMNSNVKYLTGSGGCFLNSIANQKIVDLGLFDDHFYVPASDDGGISIGTAFYGYYNFHPDKGKVNLNNKEETVFMGKDYSEEEIMSDIENFDKIIYEKIEDEEELAKKVASFVHDGKVVGFFQGGSEMGPRALGHRSILGDPTHPDMQDIINNRVKHREWYRPFAPACTVEDAHKYFTHTTESPYMLLIAQVKEEFKEKLPSITHVDGTARLQTVRRETNQRYYDVIKEFGKLSGIPVVLNTSFNEAGEPIVETPADAIRCFLKNDIDYLVVENYLITPIRD